MATKDNSQSLFFLALVLPNGAQQAATAIKHEFATRYQSRHAFKSPAHITLFPPFQWPSQQVVQFDCLEDWCQRIAPLPIALNGFGSFPPKVVFVKPITNPQLLDAHAQLQEFLQQQLALVDPMAKKRSFVPHVTVAHRDLSRQNFELAWAEFQGRSLHVSFIATHLSLLRHNGAQWEIFREWPFTGDSLGAV